MDIFKEGGGVDVFYTRSFSQPPDDGAAQYQTFFSGASNNGLRFGTPEKERAPGWVHQ